MIRILPVILYFPLMTLLLACNPSEHQMDTIEKLAADGNSYILALKIGEYVHEYPNEMTRLPGYAHLLMDAGYYSECIHLCNHILHEIPGDAYTMHTLAMAFYNTLEFEKSILLYRKLLQLTPEDKSVVADYQKTVWQFNLYKQVIKLDSVINISPGSYDVVLERANLFLNMREGKAAMADYALYLDSAGFNRDAAFNRFCAAILTSLPDEAAKEIERVKKNSAPGDPLAGQLSAILTDMRTGLDKIKTLPGEKEGYELVAKSFVFLKFEPESIPYLEKAYSLDSLSIPLRLRLAYVYAVSGRKDDANTLVDGLTRQGKKVPDEIMKLIK
jgi:tetratricopeptide (TPR) repeat protein